MYEARICTSGLPAPGQGVHPLGRVLQHTAKMGRPTEEGPDGTGVDGGGRKGR